MLFKLTLIASLILNHFHGTLQEEPPKDLISTVKLPNGIKKGQTAITIYGSSPKNSKRFTINLQEGSEWYEGDIGLHMSVRLNQKRVVFNTFVNKIWKDETGFQGIPFKAGEVFKITIRLGEDNYEISINGEYYCDYPYDVPLEKLTHLIVEGKVDVREIFFKGTLVEDPNYGTLEEGSVISTVKLPDGIKKGQTAMTIYGSTPTNSDRFTINLQDNTGWRKGNIGLHISLRFDEIKVVLNAIEDNKWTNNLKRIKGTPFEAGEDFIITIRIGEENYQISINGDHYVDFPYVVPLEKLTHLTIDGKVDVLEILFEGNLVKPQ